MKVIILVIFIIIFTSLEVLSQNTGNNNKIKPGNQNNPALKPSINNVVRAKPAIIKDSTASFIMPEAEPVIETKPNGEVNWTEQFVEAEGWSAVDTIRFKNMVQAGLMAISGAKAVAQRNLLEIIKGVNVTGETRVVDMIAENDYVLTRVEGVLKGAQVIGEPTIIKGKATVRMRVSLYQPDGLAPIFKPLVDPVSSSGTESADFNKNAEVDTTTYSSSDIQQDIVTDPATGLIVDLKGEKVIPSMFPVFTDKDGKVILDLSSIYDPSTGKFPKYMELSKELLVDMKQSQAAGYIEALQLSDGKIQVEDLFVEKVSKWKKVSKWALRLGKMALLFI